MMSRWEKMGDKINKLALDWLWIALLILILVMLFIPVVNTVKSDITPPKDPWIEKIEQAEGKPVIIQTMKYGDDEKPNYARTYCQALPFKRYVGDEGIYCWVETMK